MALTNQQLKELRNTPVGSTGNRVAAAIAIMGITQSAVAAGAGLPYTYLADVARGRYQTITVQNAHKLAEFFGCQIEDLFPAREAVAS